MAMYLKNSQGQKTEDYKRRKIYTKRRNVELI